MAERVRVLWLLLLSPVLLNASDMADLDCPHSDELPDVYYYDIRGPVQKTCGRVPQRWLSSMPCSCEDMTCGCCAGIRMQTYDIDHRACMNLTYDPHEFSITADLIMNDKSIYKTSVSGKNPPPLCIPVPIGFSPPLALVLPSMDFCTKLFEIYTPGRNIHFCMDMMVRVGRANVLVLHFDCMSLGADGIAVLKPGEQGGLVPVSPPTGPEHEVPYDEVTEDRSASMTTLQP